MAGASLLTLIEVIAMLAVTQWQAAFI